MAATGGRVRSTIRSREVSTGWRGPDKSVQDLVVATLDRPRHADIIAGVRSAGAALRMMTDGDITPAVAPSPPDSGVDLYIGMGGSPEAMPPLRPSRRSAERCWCGCGHAIPKSAPR